MASGGEEDVLRLEVTVEDATLVDVVQRQRQLRDPRQHLVLRERSRRVEDARAQVASVAILHDKAEMLIVDKGVAVPDDSRVMKPLERFGLEKRSATRLRLHYVHAFEDVGGPCGIGDGVHCTLRASADGAEHAIAVRLQRRCRRTFHRPTNALRQRALMARPLHCRGSFRPERLGRPLISARMSRR